MNDEIQMMKMQSKPKRAAVVASISLALVAASALAADNHDHAADNTGKSAQTPMQMGNAAGGMMDGAMQGGSMMTGHEMGGDMSSMMKNMHTMMHGNTAGVMSGGGMMGEGNPSYDSDGDGTTSVEELRDALQSELTDFDKDDNGVLTIDEFETLNAAHQRNQMVDRFQGLDEDGDGQVTKDEMSAPADKMQRRMDHQARSTVMQGMQGSGMKAPAADKE